MAHIAILAKNSEFVEDNDIEFDNTVSLEARYAEIFRLWQYRHKLEEKDRQKVYDFLDAWAKAYTVSKTHLDFDRILGGFETKNQKKSSIHISDLLYKRFVDIDKLKKDTEITARDGEVLIKNKRMVYSLTPDKVEVRRENDKDPPITLTWRQAFEMADDALANSRMLPPNTMRLQGSVVNRIRLEAALKIRTKNWPKEQQPVVENTVGAIKFLRPASYPPYRKDYDPYDALKEAQKFASQALKKGTPLVPADLGKDLPPLHEKIGSTNSSLENQEEQDIASQPANSPVTQNEAKAAPEKEIETDFGAHLDSLERPLSLKETFLLEELLIKGKSETYKLPTQAIEITIPAEYNIQQISFNDIGPSNMEGPEDDTAFKGGPLIEQNVSSIEDTESDLHNSREQLGPYESYGFVNNEKEVSTDNKQEVFVFRVPSPTNSKDTIEFFFTDGGSHIKLLKMKNGADETIYRPDVFFESHEEICARSIAQSEALITSDIDRENKTRAASSKSDAQTPPDTGEGLPIQIALEAQRLINGMAASGPVSHVGDDAVYKQIVDIIVRRPEIFLDKKKRNLDNLLDTVNSAAHQDDPYHPPLIMDNDLLAARLEHDGIIQTREYHSHGKAYRGVSKVSSYENYVPIYEQGKLTYVEDPVYKALVKDLLNNPKGWQGKTFADITERVAHYRQELKWTRMMDENDMAKKFWSDLKSSGIVTVTNNTMKGEIKSVAHSLLNTTRFSGLRDEFSKASRYDSKNRSYELLAKRAQEEENKEDLERSKRKRTALSEQLHNVASDIIITPYVDNPLGQNHGKSWALNAAYK